MLGVGSFSNVQIIAALPANLRPGTYNLEVTANGAANFDLTIAVGGSIGPAGPAGPQGAPGTALSLPFSASADTGVPAFAVSNTGSGDGIDVIGGVSQGQNANGLGATEGAAGGPNQLGGYGVYASGGNGDSGGDGVYGAGGEIVTGCVVCFAGSGGTFVGGLGPQNMMGGGQGINVSGNGPFGVGINAVSAFAEAGLFQGAVTINGNLSKSGGSWRQESRGKAHALPNAGSRGDPLREAKNRRAMAVPERAVSRQPHNQA